MTPLRPTREVLGLPEALGTAEHILFVYGWHRSRFRHLNKLPCFVIDVINLTWEL